MQVNQERSRLNQRLRELQSAVRQRKGFRRRKVFEIDKAEKAMKFWEWDQMEMINAELDRKGKKKFSNDTLRNAEMERRKLNGHGYIPLLQAYQDLQLELDEYDAETDFMRYEIRHIFIELEFINETVKSLI